MKRVGRFFAVAALVVSVMSGVGRAQNKGEPGKFDFYLMDMPQPAAFCSVPGAGPDCKAPKRFMLHGLWTQNFDGSYPVNCSERPGPARPEANLDITPDLPLLKHEWNKHGTCTGLSPEAFFALARKAYGSFVVPSALLPADHEVEMKSAEILGMLGTINPGFPAGSIILSCKNDRLTAIEACFDKSVKPIVCRGLRSCGSDVLKIAPPTAH